jgi:hypothetical protein
MQHNPLVWVGFIQAYLLMTIIAVLLILGAGQANTRKWHVVGALAHVPPLIAAFSSLDVFASMGVFEIVWIPITFHFDLPQSRNFRSALSSAGITMLGTLPPLGDLPASRRDYCGSFRVEQRSPA